MMCLTCLIFIQCVNCMGSNGILISSKVLMIRISVKQLWIYSLPHCNCISELQQCSYTFLNMAAGNSDVKIITSN